MHPVMDALRAVRLDHLAAAVIPRSEPSIKIRSTRCAQADVPMGASRFGGLPDLPPGFSWPIFDDWPLVFVAQLNLAELPPAAGHRLPTTGWLVFFYDMESWGSEPADRGTAHVAYFDVPLSELIRTAPPEEDEFNDSPAPCLLSFTQVVDLPSLFDSLYYAEMRLELDGDEQERYCEAAMSLQELEHEDAQYHHLLGLPQPIQDDMRLQCQLVTSGAERGGSRGTSSEDIDALPPGARDWRLLLQLDTDEDGPGWMWGSAGRIYVWIRDQDLRTRDFSRIWLILQCS